MLVLLCDGVLVSNWDCGGPSRDSSSNRSKMLDRASQSALVTGEWYIPGHKLSGLRSEEPASMADAGFSSNGEATVETTWIGGEAPSMALSGEEGEEKNRVEDEQWR